MPSDIQSEFLEYVFGNDDGYVCISTQLPNKQGPFIDKFFQWPKNKDQAVNYIKKSFDKNVWFGVNLLAKPKRGKEYCIPANLLWADLDTCNPSDVVPKPHCVIESSPGRFQAIWRLDEKLDPYVAEKYCKRIAYAYRVNGADPSGWDLTQLLRVPGTYNHKYDKSPQVQLKYAFETLAPLAALGGLPEVTDVTDIVDLDVPDDLPDAEETIKKYWQSAPGTALNKTQFITLYGDEPEFDWSRVLWRLINICFEAGMTDEEVFAVALASKCNKYARDNRPVSHLWREVLRAKHSQDSINKLVGTHSPLKIPELVTSQELAGLDYNAVDQYREWAIKSTDAVTAYHELIYFIILSTVCSAGMELHTTYGTMHPNLWGLVLGDSTLTRKTTAMKMGMSFIEEIDKDRIMATDATAEGLMHGLVGRPAQVSVFFRDEITGFLDSVIHKHYMSGMLELLTQLYDVPPILTRKLRKESFTVSSPVFIFFGGGIRDRTYSLITEQMIMSGFMPRFMVVSGDADIKSLRRTGPAQQATTDQRADISKTLHRLYNTYNQTGEITLAGQNIVAQIPSKIECILTDDAWNRYGDVEDTMVAAATESGIAHLALPTYERQSKSILKMSMLVAATQHEPSDGILTVEQSDVLVATHYVQKWLPYAVDLLANSGRTTSMRLLENILIAIRREPGVLRGKIMQHYHLNRREMDEVQNTLEDRGQIRIETQGKSKLFTALD